jgi:hypothetical protein
MTTHIEKEATLLEKRYDKSVNFFEIHRIPTIPKL